MGGEGDCEPGNVILVMFYLSTPVFMSYKVLNYLFQSAFHFHFVLHGAYVFVQIDVGICVFQGPLTILKKIRIVKLVALL